MHSILKTVLTPVKWASKQVLARTLLRFPGGEPNPDIACVYCPEMCRFACPTAVVSGNDAVTPSNKMGFLYKSERWPKVMDNPLWPIYDCTGCGRCTEHCVYEMPVADRLFEARLSHRWEKAQQIHFTDLEDPVGDLAFEIGDRETAERRFKAFTSDSIREPKALYYLHSRGRHAKLSWERLFTGSSADLRQRLGSKTWFIHESAWLSRRLKKGDLVLELLTQLLSQGTNFIWPRESGKDAWDCGGEGAYARLFHKQARLMAVELWESRQGEAQGVLCFSKRCASHLREALGPQVEVLFAGEGNELREDSGTC